MRYRKMTSLLFLAAGAISGLACGRRPAPPPAGTPRLAISVVVDQARYEYLERFRPLFSAGLRQLLLESVVFTQAYHDHACSSTAPGHATLATGMHPAHTGIVGNRWFDRRAGEMVYSVEDEDDWRSPRRLLAETLGDWLKTAYPASRVFAASGKDRAAILSAGAGADAAYWYDRSEGRFVTSEYYRDSDPEWLDRFHSDPLPDRVFGNGWEPLPAVTESAEAFGVKPLDRGILTRSFPHPLGAAAPVPDQTFYSDIYQSPFIDAYLGEFAKALIEGEGLGQDAYPDLLVVSFSALDLVGHQSGPDSPEVLDTLLRLDLVLGELLEFVDERIGLDQTLISLSSDHGVAPVPEVLAARGETGRRFGAEEITCLQRVETRLDERLGHADWFLADFYLNSETLELMGVAGDVVEAEARELVEGCPGVARAWTRSELEQGDGSEEPFYALYLHAFHPQRSPDLLIQMEEYALEWPDLETSHGSPYSYDTHVPWLLRLPSATGRRIEERVRTVDVAPTLARALGLEPPADLDGMDRTPWLLQQE